MLQLIAPYGMQAAPVNCVATKFVHTSINKVRCPIYVCKVGNAHAECLFALCIAYACLLAGWVAGLLTGLFSCNPLQWTPEGRRLITGAASGELTLWNGLTFNFETILQVCVQTPNPVCTRQPQCRMRLRSGLH